MDDYFDCHHRTFEPSLIESTIRPSLLPRDRINFNFFVKFKRFYWVQNLDSMSREFIGQSAPHTTEASAKVTSKNFVSYTEIREQLKRALTSLPLSDEEHHQLIERAWKESCETVRTKLPLCRRLGHINMDLDFQLLLEHDHVYYSSDEINRCRMVPAADSSIQSLKKYEVAVSGNIEESCCCICFENFSGDGEGCEALLLCMPCEHVFHGDCIKDWLSTSHYCPLCRFEMPTS